MWGLQTEFFFLNMCICFSARQSWREGEMEGSLIHWFIPCSASVPRAGPVQGQELLSGLLSRCTGSHTASPAAAFPGVSAGSCTGSEQTRTSAHWGCCVAVCGTDQSTLVFRQLSYHSLHTGVCFRKFLLLKKLPPPFLITCFSSISLDSCLIQDHKQLFTCVPCENFKNGIYI